MAHRERLSTEAAFLIQAWFRLLTKRRRGTAALAIITDSRASPKTARLDAEDKRFTRDTHTTGSMKAKKCPPRPISASEVRVAANMPGVDAEASFSEVLDWKDSNDRKTPQRIRRPRSSRGARDLSIRLRDDVQDGPPRGTEGGGTLASIQAPSSRTSAVHADDSTAPECGQDPATTSSPCRTARDQGRDVLPSAGSRPLTAFAPGLPDASRLVLEADPSFTAITTIQAAWRGFVERLGIRKRRRAAAALRRKREGKWRQQRGVVGKQVSVGWDERRGLEDGGVDEDGETRVGGKASCIAIQVSSRGRVQ